MTNSSASRRHHATRIAINTLAALTVVLWGAAVAFPLSGIPLGSAGGLAASAALMCALIVSYREEDVVFIRGIGGGLVYKKDSKIRFFVQYFIVGVIVFGFSLMCTFRVFSELVK